MIRRARALTPDRDSLKPTTEVVAIERAPQSVLLLATWPNRFHDFSGRLIKHFGLAKLPDQSEIIDFGAGELMRLAAGRYLLLDADLGLEAPLGDSAAVVDLSDARRIFNLDGVGANDLLRRGVGIDLHLASFAVQSLRQTPIGQIDTLILRRAEENFDVLVSSSLVASFRNWLTHFGVHGVNRDT
jgi:heterotetrameric sarcosine oxidase gamma subunit